MKDEIFNTVTSLLYGHISKDEAVNKILKTHINHLSLFQKNRLDLLNWAKSELKQENNPKLGKVTTINRIERVVFLQRIIEWIK